MSTAAATRVPPTAVVLRATGSTRARLSGWNLILKAGVVFAAVLVLANIVVLAGRASSEAPCPQGQLCLPPANAVGKIGQRWKSAALNYSFEYPVLYDKIDEKTETPSGVHVSMPGLDFAPDIWIAGYPASTMRADEAFQQRLTDLKKGIPDLTLDDESFDRIPAPSLGFQRGVGGSYAGHSSLQTPARVAIVAVSVGRVTVVMSFELSGEGITSKAVQGLWGAGADLIVDTFRFS